MQFSPELHEGVAAGRITLSVRLWRRPKVRMGGRYATAGVEIEVDEIELVPFSAITPDDVGQSGEADLDALRRRAAHAGPIADETLVFRIEFHVVSEPIRRQSMLGFREESERGRELFI